MKLKKAGQFDAWQKGYVKASDLREWEKAGACHEGEEFSNTVKHRLEETAHASLDDGFKFSSARWINLAWDKKGVLGASKDAAALIDRQHPVTRQLSVA